MRAGERAREGRASDARMVRAAGAARVTETCEHDSGDNGARRGVKRGAGVRVEVRGERETGQRPEPRQSQTASSTRGETRPAVESRTGGGARIG